MGLQKDAQLVPIFSREGINMSYVDSGFGVPIVFVHGALGSKNLWRKQVGPFSNKYRVIAIDVRGHGESSKPEVGYGPNEMLLDLDGLLDHLGINRMVLVGSSMGGVLAQLYCLSHQERVLALVLVGSLARAHWLVSQEEYSRTPFDDIIEKGVLQWFTRYSSQQDIDFALEQARKSSPNFIRNAVHDFGNFDFSSRLGAIRKPTMIIVGREDRTTPPEEADIIHKGILNSELSIVPETGHLVMLEQPETFNLLVLNFLEGNLKGHPADGIFRP